VWVSERESEGVRESKRKDRWRKGRETGGRGKRKENVEREMR
jgi:hypothetical protein